jgi:hypothetical protein
MSENGSNMPQEDRKFPLYRIFHFLIPFPEFNPKLIVDMILHHYKKA